MTRNHMVGGEHKTLVKVKYQYQGIDRIARKLFRLESGSFSAWLSGWAPSALALFLARTVLTHLVKRLSTESTEARGEAAWQPDKGNEAARQGSTQWQAEHRWASDLNWSFHSFHLVLIWSGLGSLARRHAHLVLLLISSSCWIWDGHRVVLDMKNVWKTAGFSFQKCRNHMKSQDKLAETATEVTTQLVSQSSCSGPLVWTSILQSVESVESVERVLNVLSKVHPLEKCWCSLIP